jgi:hypothetical protein
MNTFYSGAPFRSGEWKKLSAIGLTMNAYRPAILIDPGQLIRICSSRYLARSGQKRQEFAVDGVGLFDRVAPCLGTAKQ